MTTIIILYSYDIEITSEITGRAPVPELIVGVRQEGKQHKSKGTFCSFKKCTHKNSSHDNTMEFVPSKRTFFSQ